MKKGAGVRGQEIGRARGRLAEKAQKAEEAEEAQGAKQIQ